MTNAKLSHYQFKSFEEYILKLKRGNADLPKNLNDELINKRYKFLKTQYKDNKEKIEIINKIFNSSKV